MSLVVGEFKETVYYSVYSLEVIRLTDAAGLEGLVLVPDFTHRILTQFWEWDLKKMIFQNLCALEH